MAESRKTRRIAEPSAPAPASATPLPPCGAIRPPRLLGALLSVVFVAAVGSGCALLDTAACFPQGGRFPECRDEPLADCIRYEGGQSVGTELCGPSFDRDNDTISTATETNPTNRIGNFPIEGFYTFDTLAWDINRSIAAFEPHNGWLDNGMNLRDQGPGYIHYRGCEDVDIDDWGTGHLLRLMEASGRDWSDSMSFRVLSRLQILDLSLRTGGFFGSGCPPDHASHRNGRDVDIRYLRKNGADGPLDRLDICDPTQKPDYDTTATLHLFNTIVFLNGDGRDGRPWVDTIFADMDCLGFVNNPDDPFIVHSASHRDHFHVRIRDPDGTAN